jgi:very-short-patch-repair endonuclease
MMLQDVHVAIPYHASVEILRNRWRCVLEPRVQFESEEKANEHVLQKGHTHQVQQMGYEVDIQIFPPKKYGVEIHGKGTSSFDRERRAFLRKHGWTMFYFSNHTIENNPEEFVQTMLLVKHLEVANIELIPDDIPEQMR